jgi:DNA-binding beta-propeller fold protein YncE
VAVDKRNGNIFVSDFANQKIRKITSDGMVSTIAGTGAAGSNDGPGHTATFNQPMGIAVDGNGIIYVADASNYVIRKIVIH